MKVDYAEKYFTVNSDYFRLKQIYKDLIERSEKEQKKIAKLRKENTLIKKYCAKNGINIS